MRSGVSEGVLVIGYGNELRRDDGAGGASHGCCRLRDSM